MVRFARHQWIRLLSIFVLLILALPASARVDQSIPKSGRTLAVLAPLEQAVLDLMHEEDISAALFAVMKDGEIVLERAFGWHDAERTRVLRPNAMMRIASISKPVTAAAVRELINDGAFALDDNAFDVGQPGGGVLPVEPFGELGDERIKEITIDHLLQHRGGWDRSEAGDLTYREVRIAREMGLASPPGRMNTMRWILSQPLEFDPGEKRAYSNIGYLALGLIVEHVSGMDLMDFIHHRVLRPIGVRTGDYMLGRTFKHEQNLREPHYDNPEMVTNVFDPEGPEVSRAYGGWHHEARVGQGGHIATTRSLLLFLEHRYISGPDIGRLRRGQDGPNWRRNHGGSLPGTNAVARQRGDGVNYVVIFNKRPSENPAYHRRIRERLDEILDAGEIDWPATR